MKAKELLKDVKYLKKIIGKSNTLPVLDCILIKDGKMISSNLDTTIVIDTEIKGEHLIDAIKFQKILQVFKDEVSIINKDGKTVITNGNKEYTLDNKDQIGGFPVIPEQGTKNCILNSDDVKNIVRASKFVANDDLRSVMYGIFFDNNHIVATNAHKLFFGKLSQENKKAPYILPSIIGNLISGFDSLEVCNAESHYTLKSGKYTIIVRLIEGKYPDWKAVLPEKFIATTKISKSDLLEAIKGASICANPTTRQIELITNRNKLKIIAMNLDYNEEFEESIEAKNTGKINVAVNYVFLKTILDNLLEEVVGIEFTAAHKALIINKEMLLMPVLKDV